ncbi:MAG: hypothetical protein NZM06_08210 [Chloroherpetonaceae bacterium]|nr:hypothetical protein [Chloroherpetonaceae bacterium]MDW8438233.1 hypothetical protein [Chloroherpetonaceae bacterium]
MEEVIKNKFEKPLGIIRRENGKLVARDAFGVKLGYYDRRLNATIEASGEIFAKGNALSALIFRNAA